MAQPPPRIAHHLQSRYPRPRIDPEWLQGCYQWLISQPGANDSSQKFLADVEEQFLRSDLIDSTLEGTGVPVQVTQSDHPEANARLAGAPVLVEIAAITEIAHSGYQLDQIRVAREERMRLGQTDDDDEGEGDLEVEGEGPMPKYPRAMLKFQLSDGTSTLGAIEYRELPEIVLGKTPLGFKMLLKNPILRHGIAFLEPSTVELLGYQSEEREVLQRSDFARGLRVRMGLPVEPPEQVENNAQQLVPPAVAVQPVRSPLREISPPPEPPLNPTYNDDANLEPRRRKLPSTNSTLVPGTQASTAPSATLVPSYNSTTTSQYFSNTGPSPSSSNRGLNRLNLGLTTAQASQAPAADDEDEEALFSHFDSAVFLEAPDTFGPDENAPPLPPATKSPTGTAPTKPFSASLSSSISLLSTSSSSNTKTNTKPTATSTRSLVPEDSIEIVSFTSSQSPALPKSQSQPKKPKGKAKEKASSASRQSSSGPGDLDLDPLFLEDLDEVDALRYTDPDFKRRQEEVFTRFSSDGPITRPAVKLAGASSSADRGRRPIKPLPRKSLSSSQGSSSQPHQSQSRSQQSQTTTNREVIEIDDSSSTPSPEVTGKKPLPKTRAGRGDDDDDDDIGVLDVHDLTDEDYNFEEEEQYDKENMPVMTRHVRRKVGNPESETLSSGLFRKEDGDVIELSDED